MVVRQFLLIKVSRYVKEIRSYDIACRAEHGMRQAPAQVQTDLPKAISASSVYADVSRCCQVALYRTVLATQERIWGF